MKLEKEFQPAWQAWSQDPSPDNASTLLQAVNPVISVGLRSVGDASPTLRGKAKQVVLQALPSYDPARGTLRTHLLGHLQGLHRFKAQQTNIIQIPERVQMDQQFLHAQENELRDQLGREPSGTELADFTGIPMSRIKYVRQYRPAVAEGATLAGLGEGDADVAEPASSALGPDEAHEAWMDFVYADLDPVSQVIMDYSLGRNGRKQLSTGAVARKLGITPGAVSQRAAKIVKRLSEREELGLF